MDNKASLHVVDQDRNPPADVDYDEEVVFSRAPLNIQVPIAQIRACRNPGEAFRLACVASGLDDKEIYMPLGIDQGYFSNIKNDKATLKVSKVPEFCRIVGNQIYAEYQASLLGCTLVPINSDLEFRHRIASTERALEEERQRYQQTFQR